MWVISSLVPKNDVHLQGHAIMSPLLQRHFQGQVSCYTNLTLFKWVVTFWPVPEKRGISINPFCSNANCWFVKFDFLKMRLAFLDGGSIWNVDYYGCFVLCSTLRIPFSHLMCPFIIGSLEWQAPFASCSCNAPCLTWNHIWHDKYAGAQLVGAYWSVSI